MFPWKDYLMGWIRNIQKYKEKRDRSGKFKKKTTRKQWSKENEEILTPMEVPILVCSP
jgi:hypothetical protein